MTKKDDTKKIKKITKKPKVTAKKAKQAKQEVVAEEIKPEITEILVAGQLTPLLLISSLFGAIIAAALGGIIWGLIVITTDYEVGFISIGVGTLSGYVALLFAKGKKGIPLQIIASLSSIFGIILGKYYMYHHDLKENVLAEYGAGAASDITYLNKQVLTYFIEDMPAMTGAYDLLWFGIAIYVAWQIPKKSSSDL